MIMPAAAPSFSLSFASLSLRESYYLGFEAGLHSKPELRPGGEDASTAAGRCSAEWDQGFGRGRASHAAFLREERRRAREERQAAKNADDLAFVFHLPGAGGKVIELYAQAADLEAQIEGLQAKIGELSIQAEAIAAGAWHPEDVAAAKSAAAGWLDR